LLSKNYIFEKKSFIKPNLLIMKNFLTSTQFAWIINGLSWIVFVLTDNHGLEILMGLLCGYAAYVGYSNSDKKLLSASLFDMAWMFLWGFGIM
jgi:hypothetical protein